MSVSSAKRHSHHRRSSSVSTRHESAELMGIALPLLPQDDLINHAEKDSSRHRALLALEGKQVEIPDFSAADDINSKPSSCPGFLNAKRDSFKLLANSTSSKDQLHTLLEEEEEEDADADASANEHRPGNARDSVKENIPPTQLSRLRPLSLTPDNLISPIPTRPRSLLRSLSLSPTPTVHDDATKPDSIKQLRRTSVIISPTPSSSSRRPVLNLSLARLDTSPPTGGAEEKKMEPRSSISYKRSSAGVTLNAAGLPTPEVTPTFGRRFSSTSGSIASSISISSQCGISDEDVLFSGPPTQSRPLSTSEQHFLFKSHHALLARITDLEKALSTRRQDSRPLSISSATPDPDACRDAEGPSDEMLRLIADLKAERDDLKRDVDGWRQRVVNLENQIVTLAKRVEAERRDAWVARSRAGLLEVEKCALVRKLEAVGGLIQSHEREKGSLQKERNTLEKEVAANLSRVEELEDELRMVKMKMEREWARTTTAFDPMATPTPTSNRSFESIVRPMVVVSPPSESTLRSLKKKQHGLGFKSVDSESSTTDVEPDSFVDELRHPFAYSLRAVQEEGDSEEESGLAGYDEEEEDDTDDLSLPSSEDLAQFPPSPTTPTNFLQKPLPPAPGPPTHSSRASLSMNWTFPKAIPPSVPTVKEDSADRFFDCLDDSDSELPGSHSGYSYEKSKGFFSRGFAFAPENDNASFFLPSGVGITVVEERMALEVVTEDAEEDEEEEGKEMEGTNSEEDEDMFGEVGGIKITFTPPQEDKDKDEEEPEQIQLSKCISPPPKLPALNFGEDDGDDPLNFRRPLLEERLPSPPPIPVKSVPVPQVSTPLPPPPPPFPPHPPSVVAEASSSGASISSSSSSRSSMSSSSRCAPFSMIPRPSSPSVIRQSNFSGCATPSTERFRTTSSSSSSVSLETFSPPPPTKRSPSPSFIPQPVSSPSLRRTKHWGSVKPNVVSTFIRRPSSRQPPVPSVIHTPISGSPNVPLNVDSISSNISTSERTAFSTFINLFVGGKGSNKNSTSSNIRLSSDDHTPKCFPSPISPTSPPHFSSPPTSVSNSAIPSTQTPPRLSFRTLTNFVPWASRNSPISTNCPVSSNLPAVNIARFSSTLASNSTSRRYLSREEQLQRLRARMEAEGVERIKPCVHVHCRKCIGEFVLF